MGEPSNGRYPENVLNVVRTLDNSLEVSQEAIISNFEKYFSEIYGSNLSKKEIADMTLSAFVYGEHIADIANIKDVDPITISQKIEHAVRSFIKYLKEDMEV